MDKKSLAHQRLMNRLYRSPIHGNSDYRVAQQFTLDNGFKWTGVYAIKSGNLTIENLTSGRMQISGKAAVMYLRWYRWMHRTRNTEPVIFVSSYLNQ